MDLKGIPTACSNPVAMPDRPSRNIQAKALMKLGSMSGIVLRAMMNGLPLIFQRETMNASGTASTMVKAEAARLTPTLLARLFQ